MSRFRNQILISVAALSIVTLMGATTGSANAMSFGGRGFGGMGGGHAMGGIGHSMGGLGGHSMGGLGGIGHSMGGLGSHSMGGLGGLGHSMGGLGHVTGGRSIGGLGQGIGGRTTGSFSGSASGLRHAGHNTAASSHLANSQTGSSHTPTDHGHNAQAHQAGGNNQADNRPAANRPADKPANGDRAANNSDDLRQVHRPGTDKPGPAMRDTVEWDRDDDVGKRVERHWNPNGTFVDTVIGTVSYGWTPDGGLVRTDDRPKNKKKVQNDCALLQAKVAELAKQLAFQQGVLAALGGAQNVTLSGTTSGVSTSFEDPEDQAQAIAKEQQQIQITSQLLAMYQADLARCMANQAALAAAAAAEGEGE